MKVIPGVSTHIRRKVYTHTASSLKAGDVFKVMRWVKYEHLMIIRPIIIHPETKEEFTCKIAFWEDASFEENLKNILEE